MLSGKSFNPCMGIILPCFPLGSISLYFSPQTKLDLNPRVEMVLQECPLGTRSNVQDCVAAAQTLQKALNQELSQGISILQSVTDQRAFFSNLSVAFGKRLQEYLAAQFVHNVSYHTLGEIGSSDH